MAEAKTRGYDDRRDAEVVAALAAEWDKARKWLADSQTKVRAAALADAAKASREHGLDNFAGRILALALLENRYPVAPPSVPASVVAWLATSDEAAAHNGETFNAPRFARRAGQHADWR